MPNVNPPNDDPGLSRVPNPDFDPAQPETITNSKYIPNQPIATTSYCTIGDVADYIRIDINTGTNPNTRMIEKIILRNEDEIDRRTGHTWRESQFANETLDLNNLYDAGRGMALFVTHRMIKPFDTSKGDKVEIWNGLFYQDYAAPPNAYVTVEPTMGIIYFRGFIFTLLRKHRFRVTYRYGGEQEGTTPVPRDIEKACLLMTAIDILSTDFQYSQLAYGGEGNVDKNKIMDRWQLPNRSYNHETDKN